MNSLHYPEEELLPICDPKNGTIIDIAPRTKAHRDWLYHGHVNVWVPWKEPGTVLIQAKINTHGKRDATIWGHMDCTRERFWELMGQNIAELGPEKAVKEWREETGAVFSENDLIPLWNISQVRTEPDPTSKLWNNGIILVYMLNRRMDLSDILGNSNREAWLGFEEINIETLLALTEKDNNKYLRKLIGEQYKGIFHTLREKMKQV